ncbi:hypothetical protein KFK09_013944 [Dendrobium nobile]|uniref:Uncharacterized protein n=1 Tax=Dendrobium nobile TaxID=94219 RepID=A0A8T3BBL0_DENNO|nr:hypothetical protein KFK09_013944 [Dendrobium nobile]
MKTKRNLGILNKILSTHLLNKPPFVFDRKTTNNFRTSSPYSRQPYLDTCKSNREQIERYGTWVLGSPLPSPIPFGLCFQKTKFLNLEPAILQTVSSIGVSTHKKLTFSPMKHETSINNSRNGA